ncbi:MAG: EAL domain-containing protein [Beijerinckiaceae bacterium]|nr:EAL domain-containing protein [Beijerinckiaceae bacterium]
MNSDVTRDKPDEERPGTLWVNLKTSVPYALLAVGALCLIVGVWAFVGARIAAEKEAAVMRASERADASVKSFEHYVIRTLEAVDNVMLLAVSSLNGDTPDAATRLIRQSQILDNGLIHSLDVLDSNGDMVTSTNIASPGSNHAHRDYFREAVKSLSGHLVVGAPTSTQTSDQSLIPVARRFPSSNDAVEGVILVRLKAKALVTGFDELRTQGRDYKALVGTDGVMRAAGNSVSAFARDFVAKSKVNVMQAMNVHGSYLDHYAEGKSSTYISYRTVSNYPLIAMAGVDFAPDAKQAMQISTALKLQAQKSTLVILLFSLALAFLFFRKDKAQALLRANEAKLHRLAKYDPLTGLPNRAAFEELETIELQRADVIGFEVACLFIDLDGLANINAIRGHSAGDEVLKAVARVISPMMESIGQVARIGGDEFVAMFRTAGNAETHAVLVAEEIRLAIEALPIIEGRPIALTVSIGISLFPQHARSFSDLMRCADAAMACSKVERQGLPHVFTPDMHISIANRLAMRAEFAKAIDEKQLEIFYHPKLDLSTNRPIGMEALVRWRHPTRGLISPQEFIPLAEETGLIIPMGAWVLTQACIDCRKLMLAGWSSFSVAVNISALQFGQVDLADVARRALRAAGLPAKMLELEITESMIVDQPEIVVERLNRLKKIGVTIALDDFGTGYSSLENLGRFPIDTLKIDRSFVSGLPTDSHACSIVMAIIGIAKVLNIKVLAEGIETPAQQQFLLANDCEAGQGFLYSKPMPFDQFEMWLRKCAPADEGVLVFPGRR